MSKFGKRVLIVLGFYMSLALGFSIGVWATYKGNAEYQYNKLKSQLILKESLTNI